MQKLLDHGYLEFIESWGSDERIIESARMSTQKGFRGWGPQHEESCASNGIDFGDIAGPSCNCNFPQPGDEKLLAYLWNNKHSTPFEFAGMTIEVQAPIVVFREWHRHRTQSYSEMSARYAPLPEIDYLPTSERCMMQAGKNKQAAAVVGANELTEDSANQWIELMINHYNETEALYQDGLNRGIPKELARLALTFGRYSKMRASANLRNWLHFLTLRMDPAAQFEIRQYANAVGDLIAEKFPRTWELFQISRSKK